MTSLDAVRGRLVSSAYLSELIAREGVSEAVERGRRTFLAAFDRGAGLGPAASVRALLQRGAFPLFSLLGFDSPSQIELGHDNVAATLSGGQRPTALIVAPWGASLDALWRVGVAEASRRRATWSVLYDGARLRIVDATRLYARRHLEFDLQLIGYQAQAFAAFWRSCRVETLAARTDDPRSFGALVDASDQHAAGVCRSLRDGVLTASADILGALAAPRGRRSTPARVDSALEQALTIVYRILFLLFAEARGLVPLWHPVYRESYSIEALGAAAERRARIDGLWDALRAIAKLAHAGCRAGDLRVTPFNGRLFSPSGAPLADRRDLDDGAARRAVMALTTRPSADRAGRERIAYRDLGVEQLGAVYETLLDYEPRIERGKVALVRGAGVRKQTGTFYTPQPIADYLVRRTLEPLVRNVDPDAILRLRIVDPAMGSGAFLVAACRFLAHAYEAALVRAGDRHAADVDEADRAAFRRTIAERCLYGVDLNPMAVQLARLSLWLATLAADRPLSFLDHRLQVGDSLLGAWLTSLRRTPRGRHHAGGAPLPLFDAEAAAEALREALPIRFSFETTPNDTLEQVRAKESAFAALTGDSALSRWKRIAHLWCAAWFTDGDDRPPPTAFGALSDAVLTGRGALPSAAASKYLDAADRAAADRRLFHWELEFPEVFFDDDGRRRERAGFDAVIGNPPWDMIRADAGDPGTRANTRATLVPALRFTRDAGIYAAQSAGHANRYQLFVERAIALARPGGRLGLVLPAGLALDHGSAALRRLLLSRCDVDAIVGMENSRGVFPIHRSVRFLLVTATAGSATRQIACRLGVDDLAALEPMDGDDTEAVQMSPSMLERLSGDALTIPHVRSAADLAIAERAAHLFPPLGSDRGWRARFGRELNATDDRALFQPNRGALPVIDGKHVEPFRVAVDRITRSVRAGDAARLLGSTRFRRPRLAYRDVASATNRLTLIAAVLPAGCVSTHTVFCLRTPLAGRAHHFLCGIFNSFVANFLVRLRVTTHVTTSTIERLPVPTSDLAPAAFREIAALARLLARRNDDAAFVRLNVRVARLYQLTGADFEHVLNGFPLVARDIRERCLELFRRPSGADAP